VPAATPTKLDQIVAMLSRPEGASLAELATATGWQAHSVRGALAGALKRKGHIILSEKIDGARRYRIGDGQ
jgi:lambda repressor-like predicted transcriptional regulator